MPHDPDPVTAPNEVPWPDQPPVELLALCCPGCGNNELVETVITTDLGHESALECTCCGEVCPL
ncbi:hypothetical protein ACIBG7_20140 [Nonomuraea sp. NPDC050328]|uniref:hypothetical protein n=1 Tax=Nonomuraea sp. NPDC050328 TaxID=3364361 RepID=UPI0037B88718